MNILSEEQKKNTKRNAPKFSPLRILIFHH
jgi:hypothetical protein